MTDEPNTLGDYLRARRELVTPEQVGITSLGVRRVPGLRREEVAMLSGISAEYYLRLEQGRDRRPSTQCGHDTTRHDIAERTGATVVLEHPAVGTLRLDREKLAVSGTEGIMLVVYHARPGTDSAERLALLGSMAASSTATETQPAHRQTRPTTSAPGGEHA